ncbi:oxidoreductase [Aspergillus sclerotioniger CBS 115572]|uniref:Oxidoreductase n=1 Tax=Aspergillus sclerotioniger CBS 115572 TaxID=1450535 RepID=A0A317XFN7_9EURO|nr:oxidoreductase [Aspergillus sclerotioniger CBS 115572]PWY96627.1 oxidoreductase [Aspergillus sclerotioniger CBS 115572]
MTSTTPPSSTHYLIIGGGTAGLVIANRLSENPDVNVLVLEAGPDRSSDTEIQDPDAWHGLVGSEMDWNMKFAPQAGLNNREPEHPAGKVLGGSSVINGTVYVPPSPAGIDAWAKLGNTNWKWETLELYLQKSVNVSTPDVEVCRAAGVEVEGFGEKGPIQVTYPVLEEEKNHPLLRAWGEAFQGEGYEFTKELLVQKRSVGTRAYAATVDARSGLRSGADRRFGVGAAKRENVTILTGVKVRRILFEEGSDLVVATGVEVALGDGEVVTIKATREVILSAGVFHTPQLLELSGIGDREVLSSLGIPVVVENSGVGRNLQNHLMSVLPCPLNKVPELEDVASGVKALAFVRLDEEVQADLAARFLSGEQGPDKVLRGILESPNEASAFILLGILPGATVGILVLIPCFPASRGNIHITSTDPDVPPKIDACFFSHPLDVELMARHVQKLQQIPALPALQHFFQPPAAPTDLETTKALLHETAQIAHHACGTAAMLPREAGGVVDQELLVYGTKNLRVVDASVFPLTPHGNPVATVYAVAERAADIIKAGSSVHSSR